MSNSQRILSTLIFFNLFYVSAISQVRLNGSFEFFDRQQQPAIWGKPMVSPGGAMEVSLDSTVSYEGKYSVLVRPTEACGEFSSVTLFQQLPLATLPSFKKLKMVIYVQTSNFDSLSANMSISLGTRNVSGNDGPGGWNVEKVYNESGLWYKVTRWIEPNGEKEMMIPWIVTRHCYLLRIDNYQLYLDDKLLVDVPVYDTYYPSIRDIDWLRMNSRELPAVIDAATSAWCVKEAGEASVVALGASDDLSARATMMRAAIGKILVEKAGFSVVAIDDSVRMTAALHAGKKVLVFSDNTRISTARGGWYREDTLYRSVSQGWGARMSRRLGVKYKAFAFMSTGKDSVLPKDSYEYYLSVVGNSSFYTSLEPSRIGAHETLFRQLRWHDARGAYAYRFYNLERNFDGLFFVGR